MSKRVDGIVMNDRETKYWHHDATKNGKSEFFACRGIDVRNYRRDKHVLVHHMDLIQISAKYENKIVVHLKHCSRIHWQDFPKRTHSTIISKIIQFFDEHHFRSDRSNRCQIHQRINKHFPDKCRQNIFKINSFRFNPNMIRYLLFVPVLHDQRISNPSDMV